MTTHRAATPGTRLLLSKVPEVTAYFWIIKVLCTTVGESAADFLNVNVNLGLTGTSIATGLLLVIVLAAQFAADRYTPVRYWSAVTLVSVFGTLVTDELTDNLGVPLELSTVVFALLLAATFVAWYRTEGTLSIHSIRTRRREAFYWLAILVTFALGTATGDLMAQVLGLGYLVAGIVVAVVITATALAWRLGLHPVLAFWIIYVLTRPLGASIGDYLSQPSADGGLGLGATLTSLIFFAGIIAVVVYLSVTKADVIRGGAVADEETDRRETGRGGLLQTVVVVGLLLVAGVTGYLWRAQALQSDVAVVAGRPAAAGPRPGAADPDVLPCTPRSRAPRRRNSVTSRSSASSPRTPATSSTGATSRARRPASPISRPHGTTRRRGSSHATRSRGRRSTARSTPCCASCAPPAPTLRRRRTR